MRIVFMGTPEFAIPSLKILLENQFEIPAVVTVPDKPAGRGLRLISSPVKDFSIQKNIPLLQPGSLRDPGFREELLSIAPDIIIVVAFRILPPEIFSIPRLGSFNLHASLLPKYRGAAPINWAVILGEKETGVTTFFLKERVDTGNIILQARLTIGENDTAGDLHDKLADVGAEIVLHSVRLIEAGKVMVRSQDDSESSKAPKIFKDDCRIDWGTAAIQVHNKIRGLSPRPTAFTFHTGTLLKIYRSKIVSEAGDYMPGKILNAGKNLIVGTKSGSVEILEIQQEGKKKLSAEEFMRGYRLDRGDMLG